MSDFVMGVATGSAMMAASQAATASDNEDYAIKIEICKTSQTKQEVQTCLAQLQKEKHASDIEGIEVLGAIIIFTILAAIATAIWTSR